MIPFHNRRFGQSLEDDKAEARVRAIEDFLSTLRIAAEQEASSLANGGNLGGGAATLPPPPPPPTTLAGDVSGMATATTVNRIQNIPIAAPTSAEDEKAVVYDHGTVALVYRTFTTMTLLGAWTQADISALGAADAEIANACAGDTNLANVMPAAGFLESISVKLSGDVGAAGNDLVVSVYINGVVSTLTASVVGGAGTEVEAVATVTPIAFAVSDDITVQAKKVGTPAAVRAAVQVWGRFAG